MNLIFTFILAISIGIMLFTRPESVVSAMTDGATKAVTLSLTLTAIYSLWGGISEMAEQTGVNAKIANALSPIIDRLFKKQPSEIKKQLSLNVSANLFGLSGIATPSGINAARLLGERKDYAGINTLFVLSATSIQILPTTVVSLRISYGSLSPSDIFLPTLLSTALSTVSGLALLKISDRRKRK